MEKKVERCKERLCLFADPSKPSGCADYSDISKCVMLANRRELAQWLAQ